MSKKCPWCDSINSLVDDREFEGRLYCKKCRTSILKGEETACTVFDRITASPEVLAAKLVWLLVQKYDVVWCSTILVDESFSTKAEAIAATVAKLKEVAE